MNQKKVSNSVYFQLRHKGIKLPLNRRDKAKTITDLVNYLHEGDWMSEAFRDFMLENVKTWQNSYRKTNQLKEERKNFMDIELITKLLGCGMSPTAVAATLKVHLKTLQDFCERETQVAWEDFLAHSRGFIQKKIIVEILQRLENDKNNDQLLMFAAKKLLGWVDKEQNTNVNITMLPASEKELQDALLNDPFLKDINKLEPSREINQDSVNVIDVKNE